MAKSKKKQNPTLIAMLADARERLLDRAGVERRGTLTEAELAQFEALSMVIANSRAVTSSDARVQAKVAADMLDAAGGDLTDACVESLRAALRSMGAALAQPACAA